MKIRGKMLGAIIGGLFVGLVVWVVATTPEGPPQIDRIAPPPTMEYEGNEMSEEVNGRRVWDLTAERMTVDINTQDAELVKPVGHFYNEDGRSIEFRADYGVYHYETKNINIEGNITVETSDGAKLTSGRLDWINAEGLLAATENVVITRDDIRATGDRAESTDGFNKFWLKGHAHITKGMSDEEVPAE